MNKVKEWEIVRKKLKLIYEEKGIRTCELRFDGCWIYNGLTFHHRHKRIWYYPRPELLGVFEQTILACPVCHPIVEDDRELNKKKFKQLRDVDKMWTK